MEAAVIINRAGLLQLSLPEIKSGYIGETAKDWTAKNVSSALYPARYRRILAQ